MAFPSIRNFDSLSLQEARKICIKAITRAADHEVLRLLPYIQPAAMKISEGSNSLGLIHVAAERDWLDIVIELITKYNCSSESRDKRWSTPLHYAAKGDNLRTITYLIVEQECDPTCIDNDGNTPLHIACTRDLTDIVKYLLQDGRVDPNCVNNDCNSPLLTACSHNHTNTVKLLLQDSRVDPTCVNSSGITSLHIVCTYNHIDLATCLLKNSRVDQTCVDNYGNTPLLNACKRGHADIVKCLLLDSRADPNCIDSGGNTPLLIACRYGHTSIVKCLLHDSRVDSNHVDISGSTPLLIACTRGHTIIVKYLLQDNKVDPTCFYNNGNTLLNIACTRGHADIVKCLLHDGRVDPKFADNDGNTPLHNACRYKYMNIVEQLLQDRRVHPTCVEKGGNTPLLIACKCGHTNIVKCLLQDSRVNPTCIDNDGNTPIFVACTQGHVDIVKCLLQDRRVHVTCVDSDGNTPLLIACTHGHADIVKCLLQDSRVNPSCVDSNGNAPLHIAYRFNHTHIVECLLFDSRVDPSHADSDGNSPLLIACTHDHKNIVKCLLQDSRVDPTCVDSDGNTPLHIAYKYNHTDIVQCLLQDGRVDPNCVNSDGNTPLLIACRRGHIDIANCLLKDSRVDLSFTDSDGNTPLLIACTLGRTAIVKCLLQDNRVDPTCVSSNGEMPLHIAYRCNHTDIVECLLQDSRVDPTFVDSNGNTSLHIACECGLNDIVKYMLQDSRVDPTCVNNGGNTALHIACKHGRTIIVKCLLQDSRVDPFTKNKERITPFDIARYSLRYGVLKLFEPFIQSKEEFSVDSFIKVLLTGNSSAGKSSLAQVIATRANKLPSFLDRFRSIPEVEPLTAGIIPYHINSREVGNLVLYDLAGQPEYYSSHSALMENLMQRSPALFINLVDLSTSEEELKRAIHYWLNFMDNITSGTKERSCVIMVGSHADLLTRTQLNSKSGLVEELMKKRAKKLQFMGFVAMDCRRIDTTDIRSFVSLLHNSHQVLAVHAPSMNIYCHVLYSFLYTQLNKTACILQHLSSILANEEDTPLPSDHSQLSELLSSLNDRGLIIFLKHSQLERSWVVVDKAAFIKDVNGILFAPEHFKQHCSIASNTGIVPISSLQQLFPQHNPKMLVAFLENLEFCLCFDCSSITTNLQAPLASQASSSCGSPTSPLLFFPSFVLVNRPDNLISGQQLSFGWCLGCRNHEYQYFSSRFLHVLLLRLAFTFPLASEDVPSSSPHYGLQRQCTVWRNGISWNNSDGITTIVELIEQCRWVVVLMSYSMESRPVDIMRHRSAVIGLVLSAQQQFHPQLDTIECLLSSSLLQQWPLEHIPNSYLFAMKHVARSMLLQNQFVLNYKDDSSRLSTKEALLHEPYHNLKPSSVCELMDSSKAEQHISSDLLHEVNRFCEQSLQPQDRVLHKNVRVFVDKLSMFAGRNPLEIAELKVDEIKQRMASLIASQPPPPFSSSLQDTTAVIIDLSSVPCGLLGLAHLPILMKVLSCVSNWFNFGIQLHVPHSTLRKIEIQHHVNGVERCKSEMLVSWLQGQGGETSKQFLETALSNCGHECTTDHH